MSELQDFIDMEAYDVVSGAHHRELVERYEALREAAHALVYDNGMTSRTVLWMNLEKALHYDRPA